MSIRDPGAATDGAGEADYVVVGAGSAGCVLAAALSEDPAARVVLLEAGPPDSAVEIRVPAAFPRLFNTERDWAFGTVAQPGLGGRSLFWPRGRTLGGSSSLNAQVWTRAHPADYDGWRAAGCPGWGSADLLPYEERVEGVAAPGPLADPSPATADFLAACAAAGLPPVPRADLPDGGTGAPGPGGPGAERCAPATVTQRGGRRWSAADAYLRPALGRPNLEVRTGSRVLRVVVERGRAVGVEYLDAAGARRLVRAAVETVLCAGAVGTPHLLLCSGIGDPAALRAAGVEAVVPLPGVGRDLADHLFVPLAFTAPAASPGAVPGTAPEGSPAEELRAYLASRRGPLASNLAEALAFVRSSPALAAPDLELLWMRVPFLDHGRGERRAGCTLGVVLLRPDSRGVIALDPADPFGAPRIDPRYLADPAGRDAATIAAGVRRALDVLATPPLARWVGEPLFPGRPGHPGDGAGEVVRAVAETLYHPVGTCRMGTDDGAVVDPWLRVNGVAGLRVADASVMPSVPRGHTNAPTLAIAARAADLVRAAAEPVGAGGSTTKGHGG